MTCLFVYGTLMPGESRWPLLAPLTVGDPVPDRVAGQLFDTGCGFPCAVTGPDGLIPGFTVQLAQDRLDAALGALDRVEGTAQGLFRRVQAQTELLQRVWMYEWASDLTDLTPISGWVEVRY